MTSVLCEAHKQMFARDPVAATSAYRRLGGMLAQLRAQRLSGPILALHHARLEMSEIAIMEQHTDAADWLVATLIDIVADPSAAVQDALGYFLWRAQQTLRCAPQAEQVQWRELETLLVLLECSPALAPGVLLRALRQWGAWQTLATN